MGFKYTQNMCFLLVQKILIWVLLCRSFLQCAKCALIKRSPLELGYVTFPAQIKPRSLVVNRAINKDPHILNPSDDTMNKVSHTHEWIPGQIRHHSYVPPHIHHIFVPVLIARTVQTVLVKPQENFYSLYPKHYGGYGVGSYAGGQGAGHGYQILFND